MIHAAQAVRKPHMHFAIECACSLCRPIIVAMLSAAVLYA